MAVTRDEAMDNAARALHNAEMHSSDAHDRPEVPLHYHQLADGWIDLAKLADPPDPDPEEPDSLEMIVNADQVEGYVQAMALVRVLAAATYDGLGQFEEFRSRARGVEEIFDGVPADEDGSGSYSRIADAVNLIQQYGRTDGDHHKTWLLRRVAIALTGSDLGLPEGIAP
jgi:hypothetical protein